jgi:hypothetical protein
LAKLSALNVSTDELLGLKPPKLERPRRDPETARQWKRFQRIASLPERDQKAVIRLVNSLAGAGDKSRAAS